MITIRRRIGDFGEKLAKDYLKRKGYKVINQNYLKREGEIDLIALDQKDLVFVEIKTRTEDNSMSRFQWRRFPEQSVNRSKQKKIIKTAEKYIKEYKGKVNNYRIDVISVEIDRKTKKARIKHFENILY